MYSASLMPSISANDIAAVRQKKGISIFREQGQNTALFWFLFSCCEIIHSDFKTVENQQVFST